MSWPAPRRSLRLKLVIISVIVEIAMLALLVTNSIRLIENSQVDLAKLRLDEVSQLINTALSSPLVERDYARLQEILDNSRRDEGIVYLVLYDDENNIVASSGWDKDEPLPILENDLAVDTNNNPHRFDSKLLVQISGLTYGTLYYGISTDFLLNAKSHLLKESSIIAGLEVIFSIMVLTLVGFWLTRNLVSLTNAGKEIAEGNFDINLPVKSQDEVGQLTRTFNLMANAVRTRVKELSNSEEKFHAIADYTYNWESWFGPNKNIIWLNPSVERMTGYTVEECLGMENFPLSLVYEEDRDKAAREFRFDKSDNIGTAEFRIKRKDGSIFWTQTGWQPIYDNGGQYLGVRSSTRDISTQKNAQEEVVARLDELKISEQEQKRLLSVSQQEQARMTSLLSAIRMGILFETEDQHIAYYNPAFITIWSLDESQNFTGKPSSEVYEQAESKLDDTSKQQFLLTEKQHGNDPLELILLDGRTVTQLSYPVTDAGNKVIGRLLVYEDITHERQTEEQLIYLAERDPLTGLYNRRRFQEKLTSTLEFALKHNAHGALLFFDLDEFKYINDTFGHHAGDEILLRIANELSTILRRNENFCRIGGDEFAILLPNSTQNDAETLSARVIRTISQIPFRHGGQKLRMTTSLGIALYPQHATEMEELVAHADAAMYQAKEAGKNTWRIYRKDLDTSKEMIHRLGWNTRISQAIDNEQLVLHYQGIYDTNTRELVHIETLVRMIDEEDPELLILPGNFIPFAEKNGRIIDIDRWVISKTIKTLAYEKEFPHVSITVNISGRSFDDTSLPQFIAEQLRQHNVAPNKLNIELTETAAVSDLHDAQRFIDSLRKTGCKIFLDDFGAGFSSFLYLKHLKVDVLKIDGQFIQDLPDDHTNQVFVKSIVDVAKGLDKKTVAEFVENKETYELLKQFGVDMVQGNYLHKPEATPPKDNKLADKQTLRKKTGSS